MALRNFICLGGVCFRNFAYPTGVPSGETMRKNVDRESASSVSIIGCVMADAMYSSTSSAGLWGGPKASRIVTADRSVRSGASAGVASRMDTGYIMYDVRDMIGAARAVL